MLFIVHARLSIENTFGIRKLLHRNGFIIHVEDRISLKSKELQEDYSTFKEHLPLAENGHALNNDTHVFDCIYNSSLGYPSQSVFRVLNTRLGVESYSIECRKKW